MFFSIISEGDGFVTVCRKGAIVFTGSVAIPALSNAVLNLYIFATSGITTVSVIALIGGCTLALVGCLAVAFPLWVHWTRRVTGRTTDAFLYTWGLGQYFIYLALPNFLMCICAVSQLILIVVMQPRSLFRHLSLTGIVYIFAALENVGIPLYLPQQRQFGNFEIVFFNVCVTFVSGTVVYMVHLQALSFEKCYVDVQRDNTNAPKDASKPFAIIFTDIQLSTELWARIPVTMAGAVRIHHELMRKGIITYKGYEVKTIGDSFMVVFSSAESALKFALHVQKILFSYDWPSNEIDVAYAELGAESDADYWRGLRVRVGVHFGMGEIQLDSTTKGYDYYGTVVNTAARINGTAHGGQVLVSEQAWKAVGSEARSQVHHLELGARALRGLDAPVHLLLIYESCFAGRIFPLEVVPEDTEEESQYSGSVDFAEGGANAEDFSILTTLFTVFPSKERAVLIKAFTSKWSISYDGSTGEHEMMVALHSLNRLIQSIESDPMSSEGSSICSPHTDISSSGNGDGASGISGADTPGHAEHDTPIIYL